MDRKGLAYSGALLLSLLIVSILLNQSLVLGVSRNTDIDLSVAPGQIDVGQNVTFTGAVRFAEAEEVFIH